MSKATHVIAEQYAARFRERLRPLRLVGRELEFPLVETDGTAGDIRRLWPELMREGSFTPKYDDPQTETLIVSLTGTNAVYEAEVGLGTVELLTSPCEDLFQLEAAVNAGLAALVRAARAAGMRVLGFGIQPRTPRSPQLMTPKTRYGALLEAIGKPWLHFCTTAADQLHVDIARAELLPMINWMNFISAPLVALVANSSVYAGRAGRYVSGREGLLGSVGQHRNGMTPRRFGTLEQFVAFVCAHPCYVLRHADGRLTEYNRPFQEYIHRHGPDMTAYLWHEHYTWNSARARVDQSTIEIRPACQQPPGELMAASALALGFVEALAQIETYAFSALGPDPWPTMLRYRGQVLLGGMRAEEPAKGFLHALVEMAEAGLRGRGRGEEAYLRPVWRRLEKRQAPADRARAQFLKHGMGALLDELALD
jgi:gamma-glutamylcysteine synthetase